MITAALEKTVTQELTDTEKRELVQKILESMKSQKTQTDQKQNPIKGMFKNLQITDQDINDAKQIWR